MPWYKLPHTDRVMFFATERADLEPAEAEATEHAPEETPEEGV